MKTEADRDQARIRMETETKHLPESRAISSQVGGQWTMAGLVLKGLLELHAPTSVLFTLLQLFAESVKSFSFS